MRLLTEEEVRSSPSRQDGVSEADETLYLQETLRFAKKCGHKLKLPQLTIATAQVFANQFFSRRSFKKYAQRHVVAVACLFLASKAEETPKKCRDLCHVYHMCHTGSSTALDVEGEEFAKSESPLILIGLWIGRKERVGRERSDEATRGGVATSASDDNTCTTHSTQRTRIWQSRNKFS